MLHTMTVRNYIELNSVYISEVQNNFYWMMKSAVIMKLLYAVH